MNRVFLYNYKLCVNDLGIKHEVNSCESSSDMNITAGVAVSKSLRMEHKDKNFFYWPKNA